MAAIRRKAYVLRPDALETLAGTDPKLRKGDEPNLAAIATAAGIDPTTLYQIRTRKIGLSSWVMAALVEMRENRGVDRATAEGELFDLVPVAPAAGGRQKRQPVAA